MTNTNIVDIQNAIVQMQARAINELYSILAQCRAAKQKQVEVPSEQSVVIQLQHDTIEDLLKDLKEYMSSDELDKLHCKGEINVATNLIQTLEREEY